MNLPAQYADTSPSHTGMVLPLLGLLLLLWIAYRIHERRFPVRLCRRCKGSKIFRSPFMMSARNCPRCNGSGLRKGMIR